MRVNTLVSSDAIKALRSMPDCCVDLTVTSPPYNKRNKNQGWLVTNEKYSHFDDHMPEAEYQLWQSEVLRELFRVTKPGGSVFYNHKLRWEDGILIHPLEWLRGTLWSIKQEIIWDRGLAANMRGWRFWQVDERVYWLFKPKKLDTIGKELRPRHAKMSSIWRIRPASRSEDHPAQFPIELPLRIIYSLLGRNPSRPKLVLDPFCGTGTSLVAAKLLGHNYKGIDISPRYISLARKRLTKIDDESQAFETEIGKHVIADTFAQRKKRGTVTWPFGPRPVPEQNGAPET